MKLHPTQAIIATDKHRFRVCCNGRRWGKTTLAVEEIKGKALYNENKIAYIAPTFQQARDIAWALLKKELNDIIETVNESRLELKVYNLKKTTSHIILRGWEAIETLRGQAFDFIVIDEIASMRNFFINWKEVVRPTLTDRRGEGLFISTPKGFNHFYDLFNQQDKDQDFKSFHFTTYDNPFIKKEEVEKAKIELTEDSFAQEYMADFRKAEGLVYKEFKRTLHVTHTEPQNVIKTIVGVDFGYTNPAAILDIKVDKDNRFWIRNEWYKQRQTTEQIANAILLYSPQQVYPDPAEPDRIAELTNRGLNCMEVNKDISSGIDKVREIFKQNRIKIHPDCVNLIQELETYRYPEKKADQNEKEVPIKENDHCMDCLRYALFSHEPIKQVKPSLTLNKIQSYS